MKGYKYLVPVLLIIGIAGSWSSVFNHTVKTRAEYENNVESARKYIQKDILLDGMACYDAALTIDDNIELRNEILNVYFEKYTEEDAIEYAQQIMDKYPKDKGIYERMVQYYVEKKEYVSAFCLYDKAKALSVVTNKMNEAISGIWYAYSVGVQGYTDVRDFVNGACAVGINGNWGYVDESGNQFLNVIYPVLNDYMNEFLVVQQKNEDGKNEWKLIDSAGNKRRTFPEKVKVQDAGAISEGVYAICEKDIYSYYSVDGQKRFGEYGYAGNFFDGHAVVMDGKGYYVIDNTGKQVGNIYDRIAVDSLKIGVRGERFFAKNKEKYSLYDLKGNQIGTENFDEVEPFTASCSLAAVKKDGKWGFVNTNGEIVIEPQYEEAHSFSNGFAAVKVKGKWGYINKENVVCIEPAFEDGGNFTGNGHVFVKNNSLWSMLTLYSYNH